jgi:hypothetical protein
MKIKRKYEIPPRALIFQPTTVARFGHARLVKQFDGPYELVGGTPDDRVAAHEWCSLFAPEVVFSGTHRQNPVSQGPKGTNAQRAEPQMVGLEVQ